MRWHRARPKPTALRKLGAWSLTGLRDFQLLHDVEYFRRLGTMAIVGVRLRITDYAAAVDDETRRDRELPDIRFVDGLNVRSAGIIFTNLSRSSTRVCSSGMIELLSLSDLNRLVSTARRRPWQARSIHQLATGHRHRSRTSRL